MRVTAVRVRVSARVYGRVGVCVGGGGGNRQWVGAELTYTGNIRVCGRAGRAAGHHVLDSDSSFTAYEFSNN